MARAVTASFEQLILEVEFAPGSGTYSSICGLLDVSIERTASVETDEVPDCDNEALPLAVQRSVRSQEVKASGSGVWALGSHNKMLDWWYSGATLNVRLRNAKAAASGVAGDTMIESGPALLSSLKNSRTKGKKVTAEVAIEFDGLPVRTPHA